MKKFIFLMLCVSTAVFGDNISESEKYVESGFKNVESKNYSSAINNFTKAIKLNPNNSGAYYNRGLAYIETKNLKLATKDAQKACSLGDCFLIKFMKMDGLIRK